MQCSLKWDSLTPCNRLFEGCFISLNNFGSIPDLESYWALKICIFRTSSSFLCNLILQEILFMTVWTFVWRTLLLALPPMPSTFCLLRRNDAPERWTWKSEMDVLGSDPASLFPLWGQPACREYIPPVGWPLSWGRKLVITQLLQRLHGKVQ